MRTIRTAVTAIVVLVMGIVLIVISVGEMADYSKKGADFSTLTISDIREGMMIEGDLPYNYGSYEQIKKEKEKDGFVSSGDNNLTVVLDTNLTPELVEEGFVREIVSKVQTMRKEADFNVTDRIRVYYDGNAKIAEILAANDIKGDVLAVEVVAGKGGELSKEWNINGEKVTLGVARV